MTLANHFLSQRKKKENEVPLPPLKIILQGEDNPDLDIKLKYKIVSLYDISKPFFKSKKKERK